MITKTYRLKQTDRAARTRTLIQLGGLIVKSGIAEKLGIAIGADLQREENQKQKAYTLLGMLVTQLSVPKHSAQTVELENLGKQFLFENQNTNNDQLMNETSENLITE